MSERGYTAGDVEPFRFSNSERHRTAQMEVAETLIFTSDEGQAFSGIHANRDFVESGRPPIVRPNSMFGDSKGADQKYIAYQEAAAFPDRSIIIIDQPAHGASDVLTPEQSKAIKDNGDLSPIGRSQVEAVHRRLKTTGKLVLTGEALGSRMATEFAAEAPERDFEVSHLFGFDMPGLENRLSVMGVGLGFLFRVPKSRSLYQKGQANEKLVSAFEDFQEELSEYAPIHIPTARSEAGVWARERSLITFLLRKSPLANDSGVERLERAMTANERMPVNLVFGGLSAVGRFNDKVKGKLFNLNSNYDGRIDLDLWPGDDQGLGYAPHRPRLTAYEKDHLEV